MVPEDEAIYPDLTARRFVELKATLAGVTDPAAATGKPSPPSISPTPPTDAWAGSPRACASGPRWLSALVSDPAVLVLDEPLNGADPVQRAQLIELFIRLGAEGRTVIVSSHVLAEVERMTHRVVAMVDGRLAATGDLEALRAAMTDKPRQVFVRASEPRLLAAALMEIEGVDGITLLDGAMDVTTTDPVVFARALPVDRRPQPLDHRVSR
jgi:ABC-2 type transport system ATP-binding protein